MKSPTLILLLLAIVVGCDQTIQEQTSKAPRPVTTIVLSKGVPDSSNVVSGSVKAWKTEDLGFEVGGRLEWVLEPGENIDGRIYSPDGKLLQKGTPLARIDAARYEIAVESASANLDVAKLSKESIEIQLSDSLPAELESARADLKLADIEFDRMEKLNRQNAASRSEYDKTKNDVQNREAAIKAILASQKQAKSQLRSAEAEIKRAQQALNDAKRDLENTTLYGSYRGQISQVMVVPGSVVSAGSAVLTLQMTTPIKAEIELSAEQSRRLRRQRNLPTQFTLPDGQQRNENAFVYSIDPSADPTTRTFTMTLLFLNEQFRDSLSEADDEANIALTQDIWPIKLNRLMGAPDELMVVEEKSILRDAQGAYIYAIANAKLKETMPRILKVKKVRITENDFRVPFLGNWIFRAVTFDDPSSIDELTLYTGELETGDKDPSEWEGDGVMVDSGSQWMLRPGDLVKVDLSDADVGQGFYVPMEAIYQESGRTFVFVAQDDLARKLNVTLKSPDNLDTASMVAIDAPELEEGMRLIVGGVHYLTDGEKINVVATESSKE
ncbi:efflux RND transporter periplasmic adaptor subunit [Planctomycetes bacterium K23_9]|uniref:Inner membrane protein YibH n=1 Tax=Stieleria marina TaxID=1930275 RepID=A0A517NM32_9BACT|nr:Inner membrane protein YibH [Planctomycetes bacterium K23_9]